VNRVARFAMDLLILTKYRITLVALFTGYAAIAVHGRHTTDWSFIWPCLVALFCLGGAANTVNQIIECAKDAVMDRTKARRPLPAGRISLTVAWLWAAGLLIASLGILWGNYGSPLAAGLALFTFLYYTVFYTMYLKPRHYLNIVIGGVPGAMGPLIAWAAVAGDISLAGVAMFTLIFLWTPPHVWALAIRLKDDYARAGIPMLPVVKGVDETTRQIFWYTVVLVVGSMLMPVLVPWFRGATTYWIMAGVLGTVFLVWALLLWKRRPIMPTMPLFRFSIMYIAALFLALVADGARGVLGPQT